MNLQHRKYNASEIDTSPKKASDDEKRTLPNLHSNTLREQVKKRSVMYPVTSTNVDGAQILSRQNAAPAGDVQGGVNTPPGASVASAATVKGATPLERRMTSSNRKIGDEKDVGVAVNFENAGNSSTKQAAKSQIVMADTPHQSNYKARLKPKSLQEGQALLAELLLINGTQAFEILQRAMAVIKYNVQLRIARKDTAPSTKTLTNYATKVALIEREIGELGIARADALKTVMAKRVKSKQTFFAYKSALKTLKLMEIRKVFLAIATRMEADKSDKYWLLLTQNIGDLLDEFAEIESLDRGVLLEEFEVKSKRPKSKRNDLRHLPPNWRKQFLDLNRPYEKYNHAGVLLVHCGLRPYELETGVTVTRPTSDTVLVEIGGAKVRETAGQPYRKISLRADALPPDFLITVDIHGIFRFSEPADPLRAHLGRIGKTLLAKAGKPAEKITLSAYHFRHALVTDLRSAGWATTEIAEVLGETSEKTVAYYGVRKRRGSMAPIDISIIRGKVDVPREVRKPKSIPPTKSATMPRPK